MGTALIVDDDADLCELWTFVLESEGHRVTTASDGVAALGAHDRDCPDVVITDLYLPELRGLAVISRLRAIRPDARIIAVSGDDARLKLASGLGANITLRKPVHPTVLVAATRWVLGENGPGAA